MNNEKIYVTGGGGMIGSRLVEMGCSRIISDVTNAVALDSEIKNAKPELIIHLAAKTDVDFCELPENKTFVKNVNFIGSKNTFNMSEKHDTPVIYISSDHIFSGSRWFGGYKENFNDLPVNFYGTTKLAAEGAAYTCNNVKIVRTSSLITSRRQSVYDYLSPLSEGKDIYPPSFIYRSFMHIDHFCQSLLEYSARFDNMPKVLNISGSKVVSWHKLITEYAKAMNMDTSKIHSRTKYEKNPLCADRPKRAGLNVNLSAELGLTQYDYKDAITEDVLCRL